MVQITRIAGALLVLLLGSTVSAECPYSDSLWDEMPKKKQRQLLDNPDLESLDSTCFSLFLSKYSVLRGPASPSIPRIIRQYSQKQGFFSRDLLFNALRIKSAEANKEKADKNDWTSLIARWEQLNGPMQVTISRLRKAGDIAAADSLYQVFDRGINLTGIDLIRWAQIKGVLEEYESAARLLCRAQAQDPKIQALVRHDCARLIADAGPEQQLSALNAFAGCFLESNPDIQSIQQFRRWIATVYFRYNLDSAAVSLLLKTESDTLPVGKELLAVAKNLVKEGRHAQAFFPARSAYGRLKKEKARSSCAALLSRLFHEQGALDSAIWWLEKVNHQETGSIAQAVSLYQQAGFTDRARPLISRIQPSITRDTLLIRHYLFSHQLDSACNAARALDEYARWRNNKPDALLWKIRTNLYCGKTLQAGAGIDSLTFQASWPYAEEILHYKLCFSRFSVSRDAITEWGKVEYAHYIGRPETITLSDRFTEYPVATKEIIVLRLANSFLSAREPEQALIALNNVSTENASSELRYTRADALIRAGQLDRGKTILEQLIMEYPHDVFSNKARILLMKIQGDA
ncbi:MAG: hypothetical protein GF350_08960 [Chitinivibrionales bacterium]|nr:hypothetical protein [Chitinivibrionales bacterium]